MTQKDMMVASIVSSLLAAEVGRGALRDADVGQLEHTAREFIFAAKFIINEIEKSPFQQ